MQQDLERFLNLKTPPGRLTTEQAAWFLGFSAHEIPILMAKGLLKPLGHPAHNGQKFFLAASLEDLRRDESGSVKPRMRLWNTGATKTVGKARTRRRTNGIPVKALIRPS